jgi:hypothetical protein
MLEMWPSAMDESQVAYLDTESQDLDEVLLSDRAFDTDPSKILIELSDPPNCGFASLNG